MGEHFQGAQRDYAACALRAQCLRTPETTVVRHVAFSRGREDRAEPETHTMRMQQRLDRFTLRGRTKVNGQWLLFCLVHNIEKLTHAGYAA